jgi:hypothetical protein
LTGKVRSSLGEQYRECPGRQLLDPVEALLLDMELAP